MTASQKGYSPLPRELETRTDPLTSFPHWALGLNAIFTLLGVLIGINLLSSGISFLAAGLWLRRSLG